MSGDRTASEGDPRTAAAARGLRVGVSPDVRSHRGFRRTLDRVAGRVRRLRDGPCDVAVVDADWELGAYRTPAPAVVAVAESLSPAAYRRALEHGATAVVTWDVDADALGAVLVSASRGHTTAPAWVIDVLSDRLEEPPEGLALSRPQLDLLRDLAGGHTEEQLAAARGCSPRKIRRDVAAVWAAMGVSGRTEGLVRAARWGLVGGRERSLESPPV